MVALMLIAALAAPLSAALASFLRVPLDFKINPPNTVVTIIVISSIFLASLAAVHFRPSATFPLLIYGLALSLPMASALLMWRVAPADDTSLGEYAIAIALACVYSLGLIYFINGALTRDPPQRIVATVVSMDDYMQNRQRVYFVRLSSDDPRIGDGKWRIRMTDHWDLQVGRPACVDFYRGGLGSDWYRAGECPATASEPIPALGVSETALTLPHITFKTPRL